MKNILKENLSIFPKTDEQRIRMAILGELDAINLYHQLANDSNNPKIKKLLNDIAKEEKVHVVELETLLQEFDKENDEVTKQGKKEIKTLFKEIHQLIISK